MMLKKKLLAERIVKQMMHDVTTNGEARCQNGSEHLLDLERSSASTHDSTEQWRRVTTVTPNQHTTTRTRLAYANRQYIDLLWF